MLTVADPLAIVIGIVAAGVIRSRAGIAVGWALLPVWPVAAALGAGGRGGDAALYAGAILVTAVATFLDTWAKARYRPRVARRMIPPAALGWAGATATAAGHADAAIAVLVVAVIAFADWARRRAPFRGTVGLALPIREPLTVVEGGRGAAINRHWHARHQRHALDLVVDPGGRPPRSGEPDLWAYPSMDAPVVAPIPGTVVAVMDELPDEAVGTRGSGPGNHVVIAGEHGLHVLLAHLRRGTIEVAVGDLVEVGSPIGHCGNSGDSSEPHLHVQAMRAADWLSAATVPIRFLDAEIVRNGRHLLGESTDPRRNDRLEIDPAAGR